METAKTMINIKHLLKVAAAWITIVYVVCFGGVAFIPGIWPWFMQYALHLNANPGESVTTFTTFISGLLIWNVITLFTLWLFASLFNTIKK